MSYIKFIGTNQVELVNSLNKNKKISPASSGENFIEFGFKPLSKNDQDYYHFIITGENVQVSGWIGEVTRKQEFINLFKDCTQITDASGLTIGQTIYDDLKEACCANMFLNCTNLTTPPRITSRNIAPWCYSGMFAGCTSLTSAPALPASTLAPYCYYAMFYNCKSLSTAPVLSASTLVDWCYNSMFYNCTSLTSISANFTEWKGNATSSWVTNVAPSGEFKNNNVDFVYGNNNVPVGWEDKLHIPLTFKSTGTTAVKIEKQNLYYKKNNTDWTNYYMGYITLNDGQTVSFSGSTSDRIGEFGSIVFITSGDGTLQVYGNPHSLINWKNMQHSYEFANLFKNCQNIVDASNLLLPATELVYGCYAGMFANCYRLSTAPELPASTLAQGCYNSMFLGCSNLIAAPELPATTLANGCYDTMFSGCSRLTGINLPATELAPNCYQCMFQNCSKLSTITLPATELKYNCYGLMFTGCSHLTGINVAFTVWDNGASTDRWVRDVAPTGVFTKSSILDPYTGDSYIPNGWAINNIDA